MINLFKKHFFYIPLFIFSFFIVTFSFISFLKVKDYEVNNSLEKQLILMNSIKINIDSWQDEKLLIVSELSSKLEEEINQENDFWFLSKDDILNSTKNWHFLTRKNIESLLLRAQQVSRSLEANIVFNNGLMLSHDGINQNKDYDPRDKKCFEDAFKSIKPIISDTFIGDFTNQITFNFSAPINVNDKLYAVVSLSFLLNSIYEKIKEVKIDNGYAFVLDKNGKIIVHPKKENINLFFQDVNFSTKTLYDLMKKQNEGIYSYIYEDRLRTLTFTKLKSDSFLVVSTDTKNTNTFAYELLKLLLLTGGILILMLYIILFKNRRFFSQ